jgi:ammonia channel protein AmtB
MTMSVVSVAWALVGYSLAFAPSISSGVVGDLSLSLLRFGDTLRPGTSLPEASFCTFQLVFAAITPALISGAVCGRIKFTYFIAFALMWHLLVYCPLAHWVWAPDGWLATWGVIDYAGGFVVETSSGVSALVLAFWTTSRSGHRHDVSGGAGGGGAYATVGFLACPIRGPTETAGTLGPWLLACSPLLYNNSLACPLRWLQTSPHNIPYVLLGTALLWMGWVRADGGSKRRDAGGEAPPAAAILGRATSTIASIPFSHAPCSCSSPSTEGRRSQVRGCTCRLHAALHLVLRHVAYAPAPLRPPA